ncbi:hypothetical protein [Bowmanella pacifica]|uniref:HDOD domain-containing protein n=1 Tax=Bowmanella pacifica TaxID=502051 RepID=A0A918DLS8_9ALTE|nr:hypothetical protein [Bowmanella pacifica]GGO72027.1 hypothetical protein GCM10010982_29180 [Bowmanella pacifica]
MSLELTALASLIQALQHSQASAGESLPAFLKQCQRIASLTHTASEQSERFYALLVLSISDLTPELQTAVRQLVATQLLCQRMGVNEHTAHTLLCAVSSAVLWPAGQHRALLHWLKQHNQSLWYACLLPLVRLLPHIDKPRIQAAFNRLHAPQRLTLLAALLSGEKRRDRGFAGIVKYWAPKLPPSFLSLLDSLFPFPGLLPPGTSVELQNQQPVLILSQTPTGYLVQPLVEGEQSQVMGIEQRTKSDIVRILPPLTVQNLEAIGHFWNQEWAKLQSQSDSVLKVNKNTYPIAQPPAKLLVIQELLGQSEPDLDKLARHIADEGFLARQLSEDASRRARLKLQFVEVKHALLFQGLARTRHLLIQQALLNRVNQRYFPLQEPLLQFTHLLVNCMDILASQHGVNDHGEVMTLGYFASAGLFTSPWLKKRITLPQSASPRYALSGLLAFPQADELLKHAIALAQGWRQEPLLIQAIRHHASPLSLMPRPARRLSCLLGLGLIMAREIWFAEGEAAENDYYQQAMAYLRLSPARWQYLKWQIVETTHCYCPR